MRLFPGKKRRKKFRVIHKHICHNLSEAALLTENDPDEEIAPRGCLLNLIKLQQELGDGRRVRP
jgi:hypothetical protein